MQPVVWNFPEPAPLVSLWTSCSFEREKDHSSVRGVRTQTRRGDEMSGINRIQTVANINVNGFDGFANVAVMSGHDSSPSMRHLPGKERVLPVSKPRCQVRRPESCRQTLCYRSTASTATAASATAMGRWPGRLPASTWGALVIQNALRG